MILTLPVNQAKGVKHFISSAVKGTLATVIRGFTWIFCSHPSGVLVCLSTNSQGWLSGICFWLSSVVVVLFLRRIW